MQTHTTRREALRRLGLFTALGLGVGAFSGCGGGDEAAEEVADSLLTTTPANQAATYRHVDRIAATRIIRRGPAVQALPRHAVQLDALQYEWGGRPVGIDDYMSRNRCGGLLILKDGAVALERYAMGNDAASRWTTFSVAKSITATLVGAALRDGRIASLDDGVAAYVPELRGSAYADNSIRELLRMCSGVRWNEDYLSADSDIARLSQALQQGRRGAMLDLMASRPRAAAPGTVFNYSTGESYVLGAVVAAATGRSLSDYLSEKVWARAGMGADGYWLLDAPDGLEWAATTSAPACATTAGSASSCSTRATLRCRRAGATWPATRTTRSPRTATCTPVIRSATATSGGRSRAAPMRCRTSTARSSPRASSARWCC